MLSACATPWTFSHPFSAFTVAVVAIPPHRVFHSARRRDEKKMGVQYTGPHFQPALSALFACRPLGRWRHVLPCLLQYVGFTPDVAGRAAGSPHALPSHHGPMGDSINGEDLLAVSFDSDLQTFCEPHSYQPTIVQRSLVPE